MKHKIIKATRLIAFLFLLSLSGKVKAADPPPPPPPDPDPDSRLGGSAPISGGLFILLGLGLAYGSKKIYQMKNDNLNDEN